VEQAFVSHHSWQATDLIKALRSNQPDHGMLAGGEMYSAKDE